MNGYRGQRPAARPPKRGGNQPCQAAEREAQAVRAARNRAYVSMLLREKCPGFAAALDVAVRELRAELRPQR